MINIGELNVKIRIIKRHLNGEEYFIKLYHKNGNLIGSTASRRISPTANIPTLALSERAPYGFVWYVHPYPRPARSANKVRLLTGVESKAEHEARAGSIPCRNPPENKKTEDTILVSSAFSGGADGN